MWGLTYVLTLISKIIKYIFFVMYRTIAYTVIGIIAIVFLMYMDVSPEVKAQTEIDLTSYMQLMGDRELQKLLTGTDATLVFGVPERLINQEIAKNLRGEDDEEPIYQAAFFNVPDVWIELKEDNLYVMINARLELPYVTYKTRLMLRFEVKEVDLGIVSLRLRSMRIGHVPFRWTVVLLTEFLEIEDIINDALQNIGTFNQRRLELKINLFHLFGQEESDFLLALLQFTKNHQLMKFGVINRKDEYVLGAKLDLSPIVQNELIITPIHEKKRLGDDQLQEIIEDRFVANLFTKGNRVEFNEEEIRAVIDHLLLQEIEDTDPILFASLIDEDYWLNVYYPETYVTDRILLEVPVKLGKGHHSVRTYLQFELALVPRGSDLIIRVNQAYINHLSVGKDLVHHLFANDKGELSTLVQEGIILKDFLKPLTENGLTVHEIAIREGKVIFIFNYFIIDDMLTEILDSVDIPAINHIVQDILDHLDDEEKLFELSNELLDTYNGLSEEEKQKLMDIVNDYIHRIPNLPFDMGESENG